MGTKVKPDPCTFKYNGGLLYNVVKIDKFSTLSSQILNLVLQKKFVNEKDYLWVS